MKQLNILIILFALSLSTKAQHFLNPILSGFYPDPSICRAGDDYYLVNSSFAYYPGLPIFHSKDLVNWKQVGSVLNRPEQLNLDGAGVSRGLFAPSISYHNGTFYLVCTLIDKGGNFVVTTKDPKGPWSNPVWLPEADGIDPSLFFDEDGKAYIVYNSIPPDNKSMHDGHRTIRINEFDAQQLKVVSNNRIIVNGGTDMAKKPVWIEAPHMLKKDGWYYLICAEGGTGYNHSEVVFRTRSLNEPFIPYEKNPILTQRHLDRSRKDPITTAGHADLVEGPDGKWWGVFLGCRPYDGDHYNAGRETFMAPVEWTNGWPVFNLGGDEIKYSYPINAMLNDSAEKYNGNFFFYDNFDSATLNNRYSFLRTVREQWYAQRDGQLEMQLRPQTCSGKENPSFVGFRQQHLKGIAAASLNFSPKAPDEQAGLLIFQNERHYYFLCVGLQNGKTAVQLYRGRGKESSNPEPELVASVPVNIKKKESIILTIDAHGDTYSFHYTKNARHRYLLKDSIDARFLSTCTAGGFVGCMYAMYATSNGQPSTNKARFHWFASRSDDEVYKSK